jgi:hypothetical protein
MSMPGFAADASLGRGLEAYGGYSGDGYPATGVLAAGWCSDKCQELYTVCQGLCTLGDAIGGLFDGGDGGGGGPPQCCPFGTSCRCGGSCQTVDGQLQCVNGVCLRPDQVCP